MQMPLPEVEDSKFVIFFKLLIIVGSMAVMAFTTLSQVVTCFTQK